MEGLSDLASWAWGCLMGYLGRATWFLGQPTCGGGWPTRVWSAGMGFWPTAPLLALLSPLCLFLHCFEYEKLLHTTFMHNLWN